MMYLDPIVASLFALYKKVDRSAESIALALMHLSNTAGVQMVASLQRGLHPQSISEELRGKIARIIYALKSNKHHIRLVLVTVDGIADKSVGEDALLGLEIEARKQAEIQQQNIT